MKHVAALALLVGVLGTTLGAADFDIGISGSEKGISGFSFSIGDYYRIPHQEIIMIERSVPRHEMSVVYLLSNRSHRDPQFIANLRMRGFSWWDITVHLGLDPYTLYVVDTHRHSGPPYGKAYGYYKEGKKHRLRDDEIVELANIRFLSKYHRVTPDEIIDRRRGGEDYFRIDDHYRSHHPSRVERSEFRQYEEKRGGERYKHDREPRERKPHQERGGAEVRIKN